MRAGRSGRVAMRYRAAYERCPHCHARHSQDSLHACAACARPTKRMRRDLRGEDEAPSYEDGGEEGEVCGGAHGKVLFGDGMRRRGRQRTGEERLRDNTKAGRTQLSLLLPKLPSLPAGAREGLQRKLTELWQHYVSCYYARDPKGILRYAEVKIIALCYYALPALGFPVALLELSRHHPIKERVGVKPDTLMQSYHAMRGLCASAFRRVPYTRLMPPYISRYARELGWSRSKHPAAFAQAEAVAAIVATALDLQYKTKTRDQRRRVEAIAASVLFTLYRKARPDDADDARECLQRAAYLEQAQVTHEFVERIGGRGSRLRRFITQNVSLPAPPRAPPPP